MRSLRTSVVLGSILWTLGLLAAWALFLTFYANSLSHTRMVRIHSYPHVLMLSSIATMIAGFWIVRTALAPLRELRRRLAEIERGASTEVGGGYPREVQDVVNDLNGLLAHQARSVSRAQAKAGDLAHGLKTPLAILVHEAEHVEALGHADLASSIHEQIERMRRQIEYHLAHARAAASAATPTARSSVADSADSLVRTLRRLYASRGLTIDTTVGGDYAVRCQRQDLDEMLGNLLDNACKWARTRVIVRAQPSNEQIVISVDDDGPGIEAAMREAVLQRGVRADEASPGSGFGLAIVRELAEVYGGSVSLSSSLSGGLRAELRLPSAS
ncbi:MAG TPA: ATP-binding protein [Vicinamibacterales bacterium]|nr:ATP-binding protein [Vicinamibacterales bacterium]